MSPPPFLAWDWDRLGTFTNYIELQHHVSATSSQRALWPGHIVQYPYLYEKYQFCAGFLSLILNLRHKFICFEASCQANKSTTLLGNNLFICTFAYTTSTSSAAAAALNHNKSLLFFCCCCYGQTFAATTKSTKTVTKLTEIKIARVIQDSPFPNLLVYQSQL